MAQYVWLSFVFCQDGPERSGMYVKIHRSAMEISSSRQETVETLLLAEPTGKDCAVYRRDQMVRNRQGDSDSPGGRNIEAARIGSITVPPSKLESEIQPTARQSAEASWA